MRRETYRSIGAVIGLLFGIAATVAFGFSGQIIPSALLSAGGCVVGAVLAERIHAGNRD